MKIGNEQSFIAFEFKEDLPEHLPSGTDIACSVEVSIGGFNGRIESVWFSREDINLFLSGFRSLEENRKGSVNLVNLSSPSEYNPLRFEIFSIDDIGHFAVRADLLKVNYVGDSIHPLKVSVSFPIDAGDLPSMLIEFRKLFNCK
ncbi:MAG: hypothetical protein LC729_03815 [Acidobacteria bacterium]|nr:hypothetical protein [Acidobacteriota bacterium]